MISLHDNPPPPYLTGRGGQGLVDGGTLYGLKYFQSLVERHGEAVAGANLRVLI